MVRDGFEGRHSIVFVGAEDGLVRKRELVIAATDDRGGIQEYRRSAKSFPLVLGF